MQPGWLLVLLEASLGLFTGQQQNFPSARENKPLGYKHFPGLCCVLFTTVLWDKACCVSKYTVRVGEGYIVGIGAEQGEFLHLEPITAVTLLPGH